VDLRATSIGYFPSEWLLAAHGQARVSDGTRTISADDVRYDLYNERVLATGHVQVTYKGTTVDCAAFAFDRRSGQAHYIALDGEPRAFVAMRGSDAAPAPPPPGTFDAADIAGLRPYIKGPHVIVIPQTSVRFTPAEFPTGIGPSGKLPTFLYTFASNPNLYQTSLPTATLDQPFGLAGGENALTQFRVRYSTNYGAGAGIEQHLIDGNRAYLALAAIAGRNPEVNFLGYSQLGKRSTANVSASSFQGTNQIQTRFTYSMPNLNTEFDASQIDHYAAQTVQAATPDKTIPHVLAYKFLASYNHVFAPGSSPFESQWFSSIGGSLYTLSGLHGPWKSDLGARFDYALSSYNFPHNTLSTTLTLSAGRQIVRNLQFYGYAQFAQFDNRYRYNASQYLGLPGLTNPYIAPDGTPYYGYYAYSGLATSRTYSGSLAYTPNSNFNISVALAHAHDFPSQFHGYGRPPLQATLNLRVRITSTVQIAYYRQYNFGWAGQYFAPGASFVITP
jgi:hypothetical protein